jgi:hypothetical protein
MSFEILKSGLSFLKSVLSEDGQGSYSRTASLIIVISTVAWITFLVVKNHAMPDMAGPASFLTTGVGIHYGTNKASDIIASWKGTKE